MKKLLQQLLLASALALPVAVQAAASGYPLDRAPDRSRDVAALQNGAKLFVNYCLNCHAAAAMRYNRLVDIGLTESQISQNLLLATDKVGDTMRVAMQPADARAWFGAPPPDLSVIARSRSSAQGTGADWLYTYLRTFYRDDAKATGWNNLVFPDAAMPHALWELQGIQVARYGETADAHDPSKMVRKFQGFEQVTPGKMTRLEYDTAVADLVAYLSYMSEPSQAQRKRLGVWVLLFLAVFFVITWRLNAAFWKDVK